MGEIMKLSKNFLKLSSSLVAISFILPAVPAFAQEAKTAEETVVVTGQRAQLRSAQKIKQNASQIVDAVTAVDIGALPDRSVAEALQRISGLTVQRTSEARDPIRLTGSGGDVAIRGLQWVRSETNGRDVFSAKNGRGLSWGDVSSDLLAGIEVYKNASAELIEGGVGGTVNLKTRMPFDSKKPVFAFTIDRTRGDLDLQNRFSGSILASNRWNTKIGEIGLLVNYSNVDEGNTTNVIGLGRYDVTATVGGQTKYIPNSLGWRTIDWHQLRTAANVALQWRPNDSMDFSFVAFQAKAHPKNNEYNAGFYNDNGDLGSAASVASYKFDQNGFFQSGTVKQASITTNVRYGDDRNETTDFSLNGVWRVNDKLKVSGDVQYVKSTSDVISNSVFAQSAFRPDAFLDISGDLPTISIAANNQTGTASNYWYAAAMDHLEANSGDSTAARLDAEYEIDSGWLKSFRFGVRATDKDYETLQTGYNWAFLSNQYWGNGGGSPALLDGTIAGPNNWSGVPANPGIRNYATQVDFSNFMQGDVPNPGTLWFPSESLVSQGTGFTYSQLQATKTSGWGWTPLDTDLTKLKDSGFNQQKEKTTAIYGLLRFGGEVPLNGEQKALDGNFGVRIVKTESEGSSFISTAATIGPVGATCTANCTDYNKALAFGIGVFPYSGKTDYTEVLPSLNLRLKYNDKLQFRVAASKGMVRPLLSWLSPYSNLGSEFSFCNTTLTTFAVCTNPAPRFTGTGGNPYLKPILSNNFDATAEWYFAPTGSLTFNIFKKDISNYIGTANQVETYTNNNTSITYNVNRYANGSETGKLLGFEIAYQQFFDFLPGAFSGLGMQANYTHIDSSGGRNAAASVFDGNQIVGSNQNVLPLEGMSPDSYNVALMYEKYGVSARLAYNWRSEYLLTTSAANVNRPIWNEEYGQLEASVFYTLNKNLKIGVQGTNLGQDATLLRVSSDLAKPLETQFYSAIKTDRKVSLVLRASF